MGPDPNEDLIGHTVTIEGTQFSITGTATWSSQYVNVKDAFGRESCLQAGLARQHKLQNGTAAGS